MPANPPMNTPAQITAGAAEPAGVLSIQPRGGLLVDLRPRVQRGEYGNA